MLGIVCNIKLMKETMTMASIPTQEEVVAATRKSQEAMMATIKTWLETVRTATPKLTSVYAPLTDKLPKLPASLPFADKLPTPQDAVANAYHLAEQLLASQRKFAEELLKATAPLMPGRGESPAEVPSRSAWQEAVTHSEPKTPAASTPPKAAASTAPKAEPARPAAAASTAPKAEPARPAAAASTPPKAEPARPAAKSTPATSARKSTTATSTRKSAGAKTAAPKGTDAS
jgi:hypothetical protein